MKKVMMLLILLSCFVMGGYAQKNSKCGLITVTVPDSWKTQNPDVGTLGKMLMLMDSDRPSYVYSLTEYHLEVDDLDYAMASLIRNNQSAFYKGAVWGKTEKTQLDGYDALKMDFTNYIFGEKHLCTVYCLINGSTTDVILFMRKDGKPNIFASTLKTIKIAEDVLPNNSISARQELKNIHDGMVKSSGFGKDLGDGITLNNMDVSDTEDVVIYEFGIQDIEDINKISKEKKDAYAQRIRFGILNVLNKLKSNFKALGRCIDEGYDVKVIIQDKKKDEVCVLRFKNAELLSSFEE
ncbi:hypothetical protein [uncultured Prevotella sp.]|uniref:hypothetical protein n=1 Tax=uncultured Prevotella sp. TaxID=159272 RepID=UPI0025E275B5|nr:hypothetical protein [uncultured Prevotella sp.]